MAKTAAPPTPSPPLIQQLEHEYEVLQQLSLSVVIKPLGLKRHGSQAILILEDSDVRPVTESLGIPLEIDRFLKIGIGAASALAEIHKSNWIHKDIKPQNIFFNPKTNHIKLTGFGIASPLAQGLQTTTLTQGTAPHPTTSSIQGLVGREKEIADLLNAYSRTADQGKPEIWLIRGPSGIGKSALADEVLHHTLERRGFLIAGKFDQIRDDSPYFTIAQALRKLVQQILNQKEEEISAWRTQILSVLGVNGQLMVDLIPELEIILGQQSPLAELPPVQAKVRFQEVLRKFLQCFASANHPLTFFLDDLQWDPAAASPSSAGTQRRFLKLLETSDQQIDRLSKLVENLLDISRMSTNALTLDLKEVDLSQLTRETQAKLMIRDHGIGSG